MKKLILVLLLFIGVHNITTAPCRTNLKEENLERIEEKRQEILHKEQVEKILSVIRILESDNRYHVRGRSNEYGAYQFTPAVWVNYSIKFFNEELDITIEENQDKVAFKKVEWLLEKGYSKKQIASFWNSGSVHWEGRVGTNSFGVRYNTPRYVKEFINILNTV